MPGFRPEPRSACSLALALLRTVFDVMEVLGR
jgi:hypothetical protein